MVSRVKGRMQILPDVSGLNDSDCKFKLAGCNAFDDLQ